MAAYLLKDYQPFRYTVIFLDIYMDGISGIETAKSIREMDDCTGIVFLTFSFSFDRQDFAGKFHPVSDVDLCSMAW